MKEIAFENTLRESLNRAAELDYVASIPPDEEPEPITPEYTRKMRRLLRNPARYVKNLRRPPVLRALRSAAAVFITMAATLAVIFGAVMAVFPEARTAVLNHFRTQSGRNMWYDVIKPGGTLMMDDLTIGYIPEGFEPAGRNPAGCWYRSEEVYGDLGIFILTLDSSSISAGFIVNTEGFDCYATTINGRDADVYIGTAEDTGNMIAICFEEESTFVFVTAWFDIEELIKVAESIDVERR